MGRMNGLGAFFYPAASPVPGSEGVVMRYLIAGAGPAGVVAAETLRTSDPSSEVVLVGGEPEPPYSRMAIPYYLAKKIDESSTHLRHDPRHFEARGIGLIQDRVASVDTDRSRIVLTSGGEVLNYDRLLLATGSQPVSPPITGLDQPGIHHCWTLADARHIARLAAPGTRVVLVGAGFIGCIIMESLLARGVKLSVVEMGDRMVPRMLDAVAGNLLKNWCIDKGVTVRTATRIIGVERAAENLRVQVEPGDSLAADLIVIAAGVKPNIGYLSSSRIKTASGVIVDDCLQTSTPGVYAGGDICEGIDWSTRVRAVHAIQPTAAEHGRIAALNMSGRETRYRGSLNMNVLDTMGLISTSYGLWMGVPDGDEARLLDEPRYRYLKLQFQGDTLVGSVSLGLTEQVGVIRGLIQSKTRLGAWKRRLQTDPTRVMEAYLACTQNL